MKRKVSGFYYENLALVAPIFGIILCLIGAFAVAKSLTAESWHTIEGKVIESKVIDGFDSAEPFVSYRYEVNGKDYTSNKISFLFNDDWHAEKVVAAYPQNKIVIVYYDPTNPADSVLKRSLSIAAILRLIAGVLCLGIWQWARVKVKMPRSS